MRRGRREREREKKYIVLEERHREKSASELGKETLGEKLSKRTTLTKTVGRRMELDKEEARK